MDVVEENVYLKLTKIGWNATGPVPEWQVELRKWDDANERLRQDMLHGVWDQSNIIEEVPWRPS